jgi:GT2 family glycosyltransferase/glycosyltransferase involved in cell wall biosynthesis
MASDVHPPARRSRTAGGRASAAGQARTRPAGAIEAADHRHILGWAWDPEAPDNAAGIEILIDDAVVLTTRANLFRPDLLEEGYGNGRHGFFIHNLESYAGPGARTVRGVRASDQRELDGSPVTISRGDDAPSPRPTPEPAPAPEPEARIEAAPPAVQAPPPERPTPAPIGNLDRVSFEEIAGWVWDEATPETPVDIEILDGDTVVLRLPADRYRSDLVNAGPRHGNHGFVVHGLGGVFSLSRHLVRVRRASDGQDLPGSPTWITRPQLDDQAMHFMTESVMSVIAAATKPDDLAQPIGHILSLLNELINAHELLTHTPGTTRISPADLAAMMPLSGRTHELVEQLRATYEPLYFEPADPPEVSIVIPVFNKFSVTYDCLRSIARSPSLRTFEIIIADDCSNDETLLAPLVLSGAVRIVRNPRNLGFIGTCNAGAAVARGKYLFFLNNDTLVQDGWLDELVETFEEVPNIGIAGSKLLFADGKLQEAGGIIWRLGDGWNWGRGRDPEDVGFMHLRDADWVSGAALMIEKTLFDQLNGFDTYYAPAYYEDTDLAFRVRAMGRRVVVQPASRIVHLEGVSNGTDTAGTGLKRFQVVNHAKFYRRWKDTLITHRLNGEQPELEAERLVRKRAFFIDDSVPTPDQDAGSNAAFEHMRTLQALGYKVTFLPADNMARIDPYTAKLQKLGIECLYHPHFWSVEEVFRKTVHKPDLIYLHRHSNASKYAAMARRHFPDCRIVYNVADLHFLRMERQAEREPGSVTPAQIAAQRRGELATMGETDCVIVHSPVEEAMLHDIAPGLNVKVVRWTVKPRPTPKPFRERSGTAFVGGFGHSPNADAVRHYLKDILPSVRAQAPECVTYLVGSKMPDEFRDLREPGVSPIGFVPALADILHKLRCTVVPLRYGAGIKGKVLESLAHGLPCVMTSIAAEGLELPEDLSWLVADDPATFAAKVVRLHEDEAFNLALAESGLRYIAERHSAEAIKDSLRMAISG